MKITGKCNVSANVICDSVSQAGIRIVTFEIEYWRGVLAEFNTHRMLAKNSASSRAIPFDKMMEQLRGRPVRFGEANKGMQDKGEDYNALVSTIDGYEEPDGAWYKARDLAIEAAQGFYNAGYHKQIYNRLLEPFQVMKTVVTATEFANFFWLRNDDAADPSIRELARCMLEAMQHSKPTKLAAGEWHLPYVDVNYLASEDGKYEQVFSVVEEFTPVFISTEDAIKISCARCAAVSYRNNDYDLKKSLEVYERLVGSEKKHASALEHCATPIHEQTYRQSESGIEYRGNCPTMPSTWEEGITHMDRQEQLWSGPFRGWIQQRKLVPGENYTS